MLNISEELETLKIAYQQLENNRDIKFNKFLVGSKIIVLSNLLTCQTNRISELNKICEYIIDPKKWERNNSRVFDDTNIIQEIVYKAKSNIPEPKNFIFSTSKGSRLKKTLVEIDRIISSEREVEENLESIMKKPSVKNARNGSAGL